MKTVQDVLQQIEAANDAEREERRVLEERRMHQVSTVMWVASALLVATWSRILYLAIRALFQHL